jgi:hypothetical protein
MTVELEITELNEYQRANNYIDSQKTYVTLKCLKKYCGIRNKVAIRALKSNKSIMLCVPSEFGSNKFRNEKLYKKVTTDELIQLCNNELKDLKKNKIINDSNIESYINSGLNFRMMDKYRASIDYSITSKLK